MTEKQAELLEKKYNRLIEAVRKMRGHQKEYFKYRMNSDLQLSKSQERKVDAIILEEIKEQKSKQQLLF